MTRVPVVVQCLALSLASLLLAGAARAETVVPTRRVLVIFAPPRTLRVIGAFDRGLRSPLVDSATRHVEVYDEFIDAGRFNGPAFDDAFATYLRRKYQALPPDAVVAGGREALQFLIRHPDVCPPGTPVVHAAVSVDELPAPESLPPGFVGVPTRDEFGRTIAMAMRLQPGVRRVLVVLGNRHGRDLKWRQRVVAEQASFEPRVRIELLEGLTVADFPDRLSNLTFDTIVFSPGFEIDGAGNSLAPYTVMEELAKASPVPVYGPYSTFMGTGIVGGYTADFEAQGRVAGLAVSRALDGHPVTAQDLPVSVPTAMHVDWRQIERFGLDARVLPDDVRVHFREPSVWQQYRNELLLVAAVIGLQALLIAGLLMERRRRQLAEVAVTTSRAELAHASRLAVAGELAAAVAHEINQPLGAILSNADTAEMILESGVERTDLLRRILADIRRDDIRASEVIRRLRTLLQKNDVERAPFGLDDAVAEVEMVLRPEARRRRVQLSVTPSGSTAPILGDRVQIQQVLINLVLNAMDAVADLPDDRRVVTVLARATADGAVVEVRDRGPGVATENLTKVFESFFSTKRSGMGLGLSIARTIVEAHGGHIRAEHAPGGGALFIMQLPATPAPRMTMAVPA